MEQTQNLGFLPQLPQIRNFVCRHYIITASIAVAIAAIVILGIVFAALQFSIGLDKVFHAIGTTFSSGNFSLEQGLLYFAAPILVPAAIGFLIYKIVRDRREYRRGEGVETTYAFEKGNSGGRNLLDRTDLEEGAGV